MSWPDVLSQTNLVITFMVTVMGAGAAVIGWLYRRVSKIAKEANPVDLDTARRVEVIEGDLLELNSAARDMANRMAAVERKLETVATQSDLTVIRENVTAATTTLRMLTGMVDTMYRAALRGSEQ